MKTLWISALFILVPLLLFSQVKEDSSGTKTFSIQKKKKVEIISITNTDIDLQREIQDKYLYMEKEAKNK